jgi:hypothetical protein
MNDVVCCVATLVVLKNIAIDGRGMSSGTSNKGNPTAVFTTPCWQENTQYYHRLLTLFRTINPFLVLKQWSAAEIQMQNFGE